MVFIVYIKYDLLCEWCGQLVRKFNHLTNILKIFKLFKYKFKEKTLRSFIFVLKSKREGGRINNDRKHKAKKPKKIEKRAK